MKAKMFYFWFESFTLNRNVAIANLLNNSAMRKQNCI